MILNHEDYEGHEEKQKNVEGIALAHLARRGFESNSCFDFVNFVVFVVNCFFAI